MSGPNAFSMRSANFWRQRGLTVEKIGERGSAPLSKSLPAFDTVRQGLR